MGAIFLDSWRRNFTSQTLIEEWKVVWATALEANGMTYDEVSTGLHTCQTLEYPPRLNEFLRACRPTLDDEAAFEHAVRNMHLRKNPKIINGQQVYSDAWPDNAVYWAAIELGGDLRSHPYPLLKKRWEGALRRSRAVGFREIPQPMLELPPPPKKFSESEREANRQKMRAIMDDLKFSKSNREPAA